jgi:hypothetical protein
MDYLPTLSFETIDIFSLTDDLNPVQQESMLEEVVVEVVDSPIDQLISGEDLILSDHRPSHFDQAMANIMTVSGDDQQPDSPRGALWNNVADGDAIEGRSCTPSAMPMTSPFQLRFVAGNLKTNGEHHF